MKEKGLQPDQAAQLAQQITAGKIRVSELNGLAGQEQMVSLIVAFVPLVRVLVLNGFRKV